MSTEQNKALVRRDYEELFKGNLDITDELIAADYVCHHGTGIEIRGPEGLKQLFRSNSIAFPDLQITIEDLIAEWDRVALRDTLSGTHQGELFGIPATGKHAVWSGVWIYRLAGGKIAEIWGQADAMSLMQQLGVTPPAALGGE